MTSSSYAGNPRFGYTPKMTFKVTNWSAYEAGLRRRGSLTLWVSDEAIAAWRAAPRKTPGGQQGNRKKASAFRLADTSVGSVVVVSRSYESAHVGPLC